MTAAESEGPESGAEGEAKAATATVEARRWINKAVLWLRVSSVVCRKDVATKRVQACTMSAV